MPVRSNADTARLMRKSLSRSTPHRMRLRAIVAVGGWYRGASPAGNGLAPPLIGGFSLSATGRSAAQGRVVLTNREVRFKEQHLLARLCAPAASTVRPELTVHIKT